MIARQDVVEGPGMHTGSDTIIDRGELGGSTPKQV